MALTFQNVLAAEAEQALLNSSEFGVAVVHTAPDGTVEELVGVMDYGELHNGQPEPTTPRGTRIQQRAILELPATVLIVEERSGGAYPSRFTINGQVWIAVWISGKDDATQSVIIQRVEQKASKRI